MAYCRLNGLRRGYCSQSGKELGLRLNGEFSENRGHSSKTPFRLVGKFLKENSEKRLKIRKEIKIYHDKFPEQIDGQLKDDFRGDSDRTNLIHISEVVQVFEDLKNRI